MRLQHNSDRIIGISSQRQRAMAPRSKKMAEPETSTTSTTSKPSIKVTKSAIPIPTGKTLSTAIPPLRSHNVSYHFPLLMDDCITCDALLSWFLSVEETRSMPWRKPWLDPKDFEGREKEFGDFLGRRAYEVWVSEVSKYCSRLVPY
jgi:A/G-specific adenine glycosylase